MTHLKAVIDSTTRTTKLGAHRLPARVIEGLEARITESGGMKQPKTGSHLQEVIELRALARDLLGHIGFLEEFITEHGLTLDATH